MILLFIGSEKLPCVDTARFSQHSVNCIMMGNEPLGMIRSIVTMAPEMPPPRRKSNA